MSAIHLLDDDEVTPEVRAVFMSVAERYGFVPNILRAMAYCPELLMTFVPFWGQVYDSPSIGPRLRALAALGTAKAQECGYCVAHMSASARRAGLSEQEIDSAGDRAMSRVVFDSREALTLEFADALTRDPDSITDEMRARLTDALSQPELVNIVLAIGLYNLTSRFLKSLSIDLEDVFQTPQVAGVGGEA